MKSYKKIVDNIKSLYNQDYSKKYRKSDEEEVENQSVKFICQLLEELTNSLQQNNTLALDIGCGTGRYFYCLKNIKKLIAVDVSPYMIEEAKNPVNKELITIDDIELICKNIFEMDFPDNSFDFIYSIGVLGEHLPLTSEFINKLHRWLKQNGKLFFTVVDIESKVKSFARRFIRKVKSIIFPASFKSFYLSYNSLNKIMKKSKFSAYKILRTVSNSEKWQGAHFICIAEKK